MGWFVELLKKELTAFLIMTISVAVGLSCYGIMMGVLLFFVRNFGHEQQWFVLPAFFMALAVSAGLGFYAAIYLRKKWMP